MQLISLSSINQILTSSTMSFELVIWCTYIGCVIAAIMSLYYKRFLGAFIRAILDNEAFTPEDAMTLKELGFHNNSFIKYQLRGRGVFSGLVFTDKDEVTIVGKSALPVYHNRIDFSKARFYIPYELRIKAELKFDKKGTHVMGVVVTVILFFILAVIVTAYGQEVFDWAKSLITG